MKGLKRFLVCVFSALLFGMSFPAGSQASSDSLYGDFGGSGLWQLDSTVWTQLASTNPLGMAASGSLLYGNFGTLGLYKYDGSIWTQLTAKQPAKMVASGSLLYADFGFPYGLYMYDGTAWTPLASSSLQDMIVPVNPNIITDTKRNTAIGINAFQSNTTGSWNTASGADALSSNISGDHNIALGFKAGYIDESFTGSYNIYIGPEVKPQELNESNTIRIGNNEDVAHTFIAGINSSYLGGSAVHEVCVAPDNQLGMCNASSRRYKEDIQDMGDASILMKLRPVTFTYKPEYAHGPRTLQYGLVAEEVAEIYPDLVLYDPKTGEPQTVSYHLVNAMVLNEVQKEHRQIVEQGQTILNQEQEIGDQRKEVSVLKEQNKELMVRLSRLDSQLNEIAARIESEIPHQARLSRLEAPVK
jgi:hypothetical protein